MQNQRERQVVFFDLAIGTSPPGRLPSMSDIARFLIERVQAGHCTRVIEGERYLIGITQAELVPLADGGEALAMLFVFADPDAADPANMHLQTRIVRRFAKEDGEGRAVSAHALMDLAPRQYGGHIFRVLLEGADRLGKTRVRSHLQAQFKAIFKDKEITVETADGEDAPAKPKLDLDAVAGDRLRAGMRDGTLKEVRLIDAAAKDRGFDAPPPIQVRRREMALKVDVPAGKTIEETLKLVKPWARENGFEEMYVRWVRERPEDADGEAIAPLQPERAKINLAQEDIGETLYAKKEFVSLAAPLGDLCDDLSDEMVRAMAALLR